MSRYLTDYWDTNFIKTPLSEESYWECKITDTETGVTGICSRTHSSKSSAYEDAWEDLMNNQRKYYANQRNKRSQNDGNSSSFWNTDLRHNSDTSNQPLQTSNEEYNYSSDYYSSSYTTHTSQNSGDSSLSSFIGWIVMILIGVIVFENTCEKPINKTVQPIYTIPNTTNNSNQITQNNFEEKRHILIGKWIKVEDAYGGTNEIGLVISFDGNVGTIISVPKAATYYHIGQIKWKDFDPERNWLKDYFNLSDSYINKEIRFKDSKTLYIYGDIYKKRSSSPN